MFRCRCLSGHELIHLDDASLVLRRPTVRVAFRHGFRRTVSAPAFFTISGR